MKRSPLRRKTPLKPSEFSRTGKQADGAEDTHSAGKARKQSSFKRKSRLRYKPSAADRAWSKAVLDRDGHRCQWPGGCQTGDSRIDPHHRYERSQRPDMRHNVAQGLALCRTHHHWLTYHRAEAIEMGLIFTETHEYAQKARRAPNKSHTSP